MCIGATDNGESLPDLVPSELEPDAPESEQQHCRAERDEVSPGAFGRHNVQRLAPSGCETITVSQLRTWMSSGRVDVVDLVIWVAVGEVGLASVRANPHH